MSLGHIGTSLTFLGRWDEALAIIENIDLEATSRAPSDRSMRVCILVWRGDLAAARSELDSISGHFDDAELQMLAGRLHVEANVLLGEGRAVEALETARRGFRVCFDNGFTFYHPFTKWLLFLSLDAALELGDREAFQQLIGTVEVARPGDRTPLLDGIEAVSRGRMCALDGDVEEAETLLRAAARRFKLLQFPFEHGRALYNLGRVLVSAGRPDAAAVLAEARELFVELGAQPWTERVDAVAVPAAVQM